MFSRLADTDLAPIHRIVRTFAEALSALNCPVSPADIERWSVIVDEAMAGRARMFHTHEHVFDLTQTPDPIEALAGLFHDIAYVQVDQGLSSRIAQVVGAYAEPEQGAYVLKPPQGDVPAQIAFELFGVQAGARLTTMTGLNELLSALVAARELAARLPLGLVAQIVGCIESTIPFRGHDAQGRTPFDRLAERLRRVNTRLSLGLDDKEITAAIHRAVRVCLRDVSGFADADAARFLDNTWKLLPETNPALRTPDVYSIREYRTALQKMEAFLGTLTADRVFLQYEGEPTTEEHQRLLEVTARNLDFAARYLRAKLYPVAILEALAVETGGDAPLELFAGGLPKPPSGGGKRLEHYPAAGGGHVPGSGSHAARGAGLWPGERDVVRSPGLAGGLVPLPALRRGGRRGGGTAGAAVLPGHVVCGGLPARPARHGHGGDRASHGAAGHHPHRAARHPGRHPRAIPLSLRERDGVRVHGVTVTAVAGQGTCHSARRGGASTPGPVPRCVSATPVDSP